MFPFRRRKAVEAPKQETQAVPRTVINVTTLISAGCTIEGSIKDPGGIKIDGTVKGDVTVEGDGLLIVSSSGAVEGNVFARKAVIAGRVKGKLVAPRLRIMSTADITGNMLYANVSTEDGAKIRGMVVIQNDAEIKTSSEESPRPQLRQVG